MNRAPAPFSMSPVLPSATHAWGGLWRLTVSRWLTVSHLLSVAGLAVALALICGGFLSSSHGPKQYLSWTVQFYFTFIVPTLAFILAGGAMRDELKSTTVDYVLTRPISRPVFVAGKFVAHLVCAQLDFLPGFAVVLGAGIWRGSPGLGVVAPALVLAQVLAVTVFSAFGFFTAALTSRFIVIGILYAGVVELGLGQIPTQLSRLSITHQLRAMLHPVLARAGALEGDGAGAAAAGYIATCGVSLAVTVMLVALTAGIFSRRQFTGTAET